jgi:hypothetical protein
LRSGPEDKYITEHFEDVDLRNGVSSNESSGTTGCGGNVGEPREEGILEMGVFISESSTT